IAEVLVCDADIERRITAGESTQRIYESAQRNGMHSLWESAVAHVRQGTTSVDELLRVVEAPPTTMEPQPARRITDTIVADAHSEHAPTIAIADRRGPAPVMQVFEGRAFDLLEEYPSGSSS